ncbi:MAG: TonB-dependent receptor [Melioribacter sp.]|nr:TonB-dependent receptor [Melioribacter sp.]
MKFHIKIVAFTLIIAANLTAQINREATINGFIYDATNREALIGANIYLKGINIGTSSNSSGFYVLPVTNPGTFELVVSYVGYKTFQQNVTITPDQNKRIDIYLNTDVILGEEIVVTGDSSRTIDKLFNKPVSKVDLSPVQLNKVPQVVESDLLRTLQSLPGIVPVSDFSSALYVRGGTPDQNLFLLDGTDVYNPEHAFGLFSTFNMEAIKKVEVYKGGFSAEYGGRLSSVINVTNNDGNRNKFEGKVSLSLLALNTTLQGPIGKFGSLSGSLRRTYFDQTLGKVIDEIPDYYFLDGNLKAFFDIDETNKLIISFYVGIDDLNFTLDKNRQESLGFDYVWGNQTGSINWRSIISPKLFGNFWITGSRFFSDFNFDDVDIKEENVIRDVTLKGALEYFFDDHWNFNFGFEQKNVSGGLKQKFTGGRVDVSKHRILYTLYLNSKWKPNPLWDIEFGVRANYFDSDKDYKNLDPRLSIKYRLTETSNLKFATGIYHQYANRIPRLFFVSIWTSADEYVKGSSASHFILGYQRELAKNIEFEIEGYYKNYTNIYSYNPTFLADIKPDTYTEDNLPLFNSSRGLFNEGSGKSFGVEFLVRKDVGAITGWVAYSLARTEFTINRVNKENPFTPRHDRTHAINIVSNLDLNNVFNELSGRQFVNYDKKWNLGLNFTFFSGQPITLPSSVYFINQFPDWEPSNNSLAIYPSGINEFRLPFYARLDLSLTYEINYKGWSLAPYLQIFNLLNRKNVWFIEYKNELKNGTIYQEVNNITMFPILPSIGVNVRF